MRILLRLFINTVVVLLLAQLFSGIAVSSWGAALLFAIVLGVLNAIVKPILVLLTLPVTILTVGLFVLVINGLLFWFASSFVNGVQIDTFATAFWAALTISAISWLASWLTEPGEYRSHRSDRAVD